jgi:hypothetical protein
MSRPTKTIVEDDVKLEQWINSLYDPNLLQKDELEQYYEAFKYHGFSRDKVLKKLQSQVKDIKLVCQLVILCALNGPVRASQTKLLNGQTPAQMGIPASGQQKTENLSCARITAATADLAAFYLKKLNVPKRIVSLECPNYLQFPSAGSIKMSKELRDLHMKFSIEFSKQIGGEFSESIYGQMEANAYLDPKLKLFEF